MLGTKSVVNARGAALDAARYYGYVSRLPPKDAFIPPRDPSPSLNTSINTWPRAVTETCGGQHTATAARHALLLGKFSARTRKRRANVVTKKRNAAPRGAVSFCRRSLRLRRSVVVPSRVGSPVPACLPAGTSLSRATSGQVRVYRLDLRRIVRAEAAGDAPRLRRRHEVHGVCVAHRATLAHLFVQGLQNALDDIGRGIVLRGRVPVPGRAVQRIRRLHQDAKQLLLHVLHLGQAVQELRDLQLGVLRGGKREEKGGQGPSRTEARRGWEACLERHAATRVGAEEARKRRARREEVARVACARKSRA